MARSIRHTCAVSKIGHTTVGDGTCRACTGASLSPTLYRKGTKYFSCFPNVFLYLVSLRHYAISLLSPQHPVCFVRIGSFQ